MLVVPLVTSYANGFDGSMMNGLQSVAEWQEYFGYPTSEQLGLFNAIQNIGALCAIPPAPFISDRFGRRTGIFTGAAITLVGAIVQLRMTYADTGGVFQAMMASPLLISELAYPTHRASLTALYGCLWFSGSIVAGWSTFGTFRIPNDWSWRIPSALQGVASLIQFVFVWFIPDSPRWLISVGRDQEARELLKKWHAGGEENNGLVHFEYHEIKRAIALEAERGKSHRSTWFDLFRTPGNRRRMRIIIAIALFSQLSGNGLIGYYLERVLSGIGIVSSRDQTLINACIAVWNFIFAVGASLGVDKFGRRKLILTSNIGMLIGFAVLTACAGVYQNTGQARAGHAVLAMVFVYQAAYAIAYTPLLVSYSVEILPFFLRAKGLAVLYITITATLIFSQYALFDGDAALPDTEDRPKPESVMADHVSSQSSKASLPLTTQPPPTGADKPRVYVEPDTALPVNRSHVASRFDGREGFQLYDLRGKPGSRSFASR
ncbi:hypothetical protein FRC10_003315 [Ceratobasidium sp. 414]|nr:hypothetical protein FRC10_003315 [Ceratobasidium sp. 414]